jgi:aldose 1-epimerase
VVKYTRNTIIFKMVDPDGSEGFPGEVTSYIEYYLAPYRWHVYMNGTATKATPIMLTSHVYWNLDGFQNPSSPTALGHNLFLPFSGTRLEVDGILIPTGNVIPNAAGSPNDFWTTPKDIGKSFDDPAMKGNCGTNCTGYDNCYIVQRSQFGSNYYAPLTDGGPWYEADPVASLRSEWSGIQVNIYSDQDAFQLYSCNFQDGAFPLPHMSNANKVQGRCH